ncbi:MAG TPA: molybdopterin-dependent oxidoreductase, partial [Burkholderiales bacterium]|nr:molybdopterin-dependent oxidoreductase [Burkholderiales bacterium]
IVSFVGKTVDSELSGNMIDLCPVGALTSKPFRYSARTWELGRRKSVSPHDGLGSNLIVQVKQNRVMRVLPLDNEAINECWLSDKDRFSYEGLNSAERLTRPMVKRAGAWHEVDWEVALEQAAAGLKAAGGDVAMLASPHATLEELYLAGKLAGALGGGADFRLRHTDFSADGRRRGIPWLGVPLAELGHLDRVLVIGSFLRKDHPLIAQRLRQAAKRGTQVHVLHSVDDDWLMPIASKRIVAPSELPDQVLYFKETLSGGKSVAVLLGNFAQQHPQAARIHAAAQALGVRVGFLGEAANSVGGYLAGLPRAGNVKAFLDQPRRAYLLLNVEPRLDCADPQAASAALGRADFVLALSAFKPEAQDAAQVVLPIAPFSETAGTFVSTEGRVQSFNGAVPPLGEARPAWKVLRVLGNLLGAPGFDYQSCDEVRDECLRGKDVGALLSNEIALQDEPAPPRRGALERVAEVPIYFADPLVRRARSLQKTLDAQPPKAWMNAALMQRLGVAAGQPVRVKQGAGEARLAAALDERLPEGCVRVAAAHASTAELGAMFGELSLEKLAVVKAA